MEEDSPEQDTDSARRSLRRRRWIPFLAYSLILILVTAVSTLAFTGLGGGDSTGPGDATSLPPETSSPPDERPSSVPLRFGAQDVAVDSVSVPAGGGASLLPFDVQIGATPTSSARAAMVSFRVECHSGDERVEMQANGKISTNVFLSRGGSVGGHALTAEADHELECTLLASAPFIEVTDDGLSNIPVRAELETQQADGTHTLALHRLDDATLVEPGSAQNVLSLQVDDPARLDRMASTVRLTSCTVVGGSRDSGENKCQESMTGRESSTVRMRVIARWLDEGGEIASSTTFWDETLAVDYDTHHVPWTLRQEGLADQVHENAEAVVLVVQVESLAGTPVVVHADGTDAVVTTS